MRSSTRSTTTSRKTRTSRPDGIINAADAARLFPQGHGDAFGHYLTALKGYYSLLVNSKFDWVPRIEAVTVLGQPVSVDYQDERKFAAAAAAVARAGRQVFDLTWRRDYQSVATSGWGHMGATRSNTQRHVPTTRHWGMDQWAARTGHGAYLNWVVGNAILPDVDPVPTHEGIQKVDRTTVPELQELVVLAEGLQTALDNAEGGLSPLGISHSSLAFDIDPTAVVGTSNGTHFEQLYQRAKVALHNAVAAFDDAKDVTRLMRGEQDSLAEFQAMVAQQELAYTNALIELYGTPYSDDIGPGKLYKQGYAGPDLMHYMYVDLDDVSFPPDYWSLTGTNEFTLEVLGQPDDWMDGDFKSPSVFNVITNIPFTIRSEGIIAKPAAWTGKRASPGRIQQAISEKITAHIRVGQTITDSTGSRDAYLKGIRVLEASMKDYDEARRLEKNTIVRDQIVEAAKFANGIWDKVNELTKDDVERAQKTTKTALPDSVIVGMATGGDLTSAAKAALDASGYTVVSVLDKVGLVRHIVVNALELANSSWKQRIEFDEIEPLNRNIEMRQAVYDLGMAIADAHAEFWQINYTMRGLQDADARVRSFIAEGDRIQQEREVFRRRSAAVIQGFRTRDAAFRIFRNEKLERYKTLFDLSARYTLLAANAYDYETGLLNTTAGRSFANRIVNARALGVVRNGEPQFAGSNTGDPGLSSVLAEMKADWDVLRGRLGFNNPDAYGTTVSLRTEALRILPGTDGDTNWKDILEQSRSRNLLDDADVRRYCMQITSGDGLPVPGPIVTFSTTIADGYNLFGKQLAAGDHAFSPSSFATKIFGVGVALDGYRGMDNPAANSGAVTGAGGTSPGDPNVWFLDPQALSATPYIYLIPVGVDSMRSPPLGDVSQIRSWVVDDVAIPMPFNIGASGFSTRQLWQSSDSLTEPLFSIRKHQAFRPVSTSSVFSTGLYGLNGTLQRSQYTNNRLVGRSVWNSQWKLVVPGKTLLNDSNEGLDRFIRTVKDIKLHFVTYSYSGN